ncbi:MAG: hypothetical protein V4691_02335 [Pseudomonadota bacterium]
MNVWFWLFLILPPLFVFSAKPENSVAWRNNRLLLAVVIAYGTLAVGAYFEEQYQQEIINTFLEQYPKCIDTLCVGKPVGHGLSEVIIIATGWVAAFFITGLYELIWRTYYSRRVRLMNYAFGENLMSNIILILAVLAIYPTYIIMWIWFDIF